MGIPLTSTQIEISLRKFLSAFPEYAETRHLDDLRRSEYSRLDEQGHIYLDFTGGGLYAASQLTQHFQLLENHVFGNPHSSNPTSLAMTELVDSARRTVLDYFNASPDEYVVIFTANASGALKLVGESFPFGSGDQFLLTFDNHNSVNGIREFARAHGAQITYVPVVLPDMHVDETQLEEYLGLARRGGNNLFAYPAQSNFSGVQHPLEWIEKARQNGWMVILDSAAFAPTNRLDLGCWKPDFIPLSFYKIFGYPTGVGCLLARKDSLARLHRPWFAGGTITVASVQGDRYYLAPNEAAFEEGTINYLNLPAVEIGLSLIDSVGIEVIHDRVISLTGFLLDELQNLRHRNGCPLVKIYGPSTIQHRGATVAMNFYDPNGVAIDHRLIEREANKVKISLRTGCFCNPGAGEIALELSKPELAACFRMSNDRLSLDDFRTCIDGKSSGAVRISIGIVSNFNDVFQFMQFSRGFLS
jgi:selenocysteine lyase/cysteine desulfurase